MGGGAPVLCAACAQQKTHAAAYHGFGVGWHAPLCVSSPFASGACSEVKPIEGDTHRGGAKGRRAVKGVFLLCGMGASKCEPWQVTVKPRLVLFF